MERMIESVRRAEELKQLNADISALYDALPGAAVAEDAWGQLGAAGLAALVESEEDESVSKTTPRAASRSMASTVIPPLPKPSQSEI